MAEQSPLDYHITTLTAHVGELNDNHANLTAIADWCAATYATPGDNHPETIARTKEYLKDALVTITQQVTSSGQALTACLDQQTLELQHIAATMRLVENRLSSQKEHIARSAMLSQFWRKQPIPRTDAESVIEAEPDRYKPTRTARCTILMEGAPLDVVRHSAADHHREHLEHDHHLQVALRLLHRLPEHLEHTTHLLVPLPVAHQLQQPH